MFILSFIPLAVLSIFVCNTKRKLLIACALLLCVGVYTYNEWDRFFLASLPFIAASMFVRVHNKNRMLYLVFFPLAIVAVALAYIARSGYCNHTGLDPLFLLWPLTACAFLALWKIRVNRIARIALAANILAMLFFLGIDSLNVMVEYNRWIHRRMPERFEKTFLSPNRPIIPPQLPQE